MPNLVHLTTISLSLTFIKGQGAFMRAHGMRTHAISSPGAELDDLRDHELVGIAPIPMARTIAPGQDLISIAQLWLALRRIRPDLIHAHTPKGGLLGMVAAVMARVPVRIYQVQGFPHMTATGLSRLLLLWSERVSAALSHEVICVSHSMRQIAIEDRICPAHKAKVILNGSANGVDAAGEFNPNRFTKIDRQRLRADLGIPADALVIGFVGRLAHDKGMHELARAWQSLREQYPMMHLLLVGPIDQRDPIHPEDEQALRGDCRVHFVGYVHDTAAIYGVMDLLVLPSYREGLPTAPLEAAAMEIPVVATKIPGCVDAIQDGVTGTLVAPRDANELTSAIRCYCDNQALRRQHGLAGRERVLREFRQEALWNALYQEYCRLLTLRGIRLPEYSDNARARVE